MIEFDTKNLPLFDMLWEMCMNIDMADTLIDDASSNSINLRVKLSKYYKRYNFYNIEEKRFRKFIWYSYYDHFIAEKNCMYMWSEVKI